MDIFRKCKYKKRITYVAGKKYINDTYKCPVCDMWFNSYCGYPYTGMKLHINRVAHKESWNKEFNKIKRTPHLNFYKKHTEVVNYGVIQRMWKF